MPHAIARVRGPRAALRIGAARRKCCTPAAAQERPSGQGVNVPEVMEEKQALHLAGAAAVAALEDLKARLARDRDLTLSLSWRLERKGTRQ